ncbi:hypothetical protein V1512DRAFT_89566, partial [Lipomyces arxii]|uniref:uncharacterized protein n=1 Tax=Lipomyces arxii TaxID=56418 RepID=UPI0034CF5DFF
MSFRGGRGGRSARDSGRPQIFGLDIKPEFKPSDLYTRFELPLETEITESEKQS